jgi:hypothetical protein
MKKSRFSEQQIAFILKQDQRRDRIRPVRTAVRLPFALVRQSASSTAAARRGG